MREDRNFADHELLEYQVLQQQDDKEQKLKAKQLQKIIEPSKKCYFKEMKICADKDKDHEGEKLSTNKM